MSKETCIYGKRPVCVERDLKRTLKKRLKDTDLRFAVTGDRKTHSKETYICVKRPIYV